MKYFLIHFSVFLFAVFSFTVTTSAQITTIIFQEGFEGLNLGPFVDETLPDVLPEPGNIAAYDANAVWSDIPPTGWVVDNSALGDGGVTEWQGWAFANKNAWVIAAGDQQRSQFTKGTGTVAICDPDEWDDLPRGDGLFNSFLRTPSISLSGVPANSAVLTFDSSWRPFANQTAIITVSYDGGRAQDVLFWTSLDGDFDFHDHMTNETVSVELNNPAGANNMVISFELIEAGNDWFWAIDNINISSGNSTIFSEDFENVVLGPFIDESVPATPPRTPVLSGSRDEVWTNEPPEGWMVDNSAMGAGGVTEWRGWGFADWAAWSIVAEDQQRSTFSNAQGTIAICDPDEWDDLPREEGSFNSFLISPPISLDGVEANTAILSFDSSWRPFANQTAIITASYDGGSPQDVLFWLSSPTDAPEYHDHMTNEKVTVPMNNPAGASNVVLSFELIEAGNDWWWAIDNVTITATGDLTSVDNWFLFD